MRLQPSAGLIATSAASLAPFRLYRPASIAEAAACLAGGPNRVAMAGGTDLVAQYNDGLAPESIVDLSGVTALTEVERDGRILRIGAGVTHGTGSAHASVRAAAPGFAAAWSRIANPRIRLRATLGGNLMARRTRYEASLLLTALEARLRVATPTGDLLLDPAGLWRGEAGPAALLTSIDIDTAGLRGFHYERSLRPLMTQAVAVFDDERGLRLSFAMASEFLAPVHVEHVLADTTLRVLRPRTRDFADELLGLLPATFRDPVVTNAYARRAGATLLARQLESLDV